LAAQLAAQRGARVSGLDASEPSVAIARERTPLGDFRVGEIEDLPWPDQTFDVVTGFNAFQFAADVVNALREARRVARPGGRTAVVVWGRQEDCEIAATASAVAGLLPPPPAGAAGPFSLAAPGRLEGLLEQAGLEPLSGGEVECSLEFPDLGTALRAMMSVGPHVAAAELVGAEPVRRAIAESLVPFRSDDGRYRQRNTFRYVIAAT
jgi:SAM-dependent methyltransferase